MFKMFFSQGREPILGKGGNMNVLDHGRMGVVARWHPFEQVLVSHLYIAGYLIYEIACIGYSAAVANKVQDRHNL